MKYLFIVILLLNLSSICYSQRNFKFHVISQVIRMKNLDGSWDNWREFGDMNQTMDVNIEVDLLSKEVIWNNKFKDDPNKFDHLKIKNVSGDYTYRDFGFWVMKIDVESNKNETILYTIAFKEIGNNTYCTLIIGDKSMQTKCYLTYEPE